MPKLCFHKLDIAGGTRGVAPISVHPVFFLHVTGPDNTSNVLALAFGMRTVTLAIAGSLWITTNQDADMMPSAALMNLQMQH
jgi:cytochrome o ubiquinol oxidase subunit IV